MSLVVEPVCPKCSQSNLKYVMMTDEVVCMNQDCDYQEILKEHNRTIRIGRGENGY